VPPSSCELCGAGPVTQKGFAAPKKFHDPDAVFSCNKCAQEFGTRNELKNHKNADHPAPRHFCVEPPNARCPVDSTARAGPALESGKLRGFVKAQILNDHVDNIHKGITHPCPVAGCEKVFTDKSSMGRHMKKDHK
jgi:uncharacterized C2H2 Zn-finger protein